MIVQLPYTITEINPRGPIGLDGRVLLGDVLLRVQNVELAPLGIAEVMSLVRGPPASEVTLVLSRAVSVDALQRAAPELTAPHATAPAFAAQIQRQIFKLELKRGAPAPDGIICVLFLSLSLSLSLVGLCARILGLSLLFSLQSSLSPSLSRTHTHPSLFTHSLSLYTGKVFHTGCLSWDFSTP